MRRAPAAAALPARHAPAVSQDSGGGSRGGRGRERTRSPGRGGRPAWCLLASLPRGRLRGTRESVARTSLHKSPFSTTNEGCGLPHLRRPGGAPGPGLPPGHPLRHQVRPHEGEPDRAGDGRRDGEGGGREEREQERSGRGGEGGPQTCSPAFTHGTRTSVASPSLTQVLQFATDQLADVKRVERLAARCMEAAATGALPAEGEKKKKEGRGAEGRRAWERREREGAHFTPSLFPCPSLNAGDTLMADAAKPAAVAGGGRGGGRAGSAASGGGGRPRRGGG